MRRAIDVEQVRRVDRGIDLGRAQTGMAEQLLYGTHIRTALNQMRREGMAQGCLLYTSDAADD